jgi:hypothetical protein
MATASVFLNIEKAFDTTWHFTLLYKLYELSFLTSFIMLIGSFFADTLVGGEFSTPKVIVTRVAQGSILAHK